MASSLPIARQKFAAASPGFGGKNSKDTLISLTLRPFLSSDRCDGAAPRRCRGRGPAREPDRHGEAGLAILRGRCQDGMLVKAKAGALKPARHELGGYAEPAMGMLLTQLFEIMRCEIDDHEPAAGPHDAGG